MHFIEIKHDQSPIMNCIPTELAELLLILHRKRTYMVPFFKGNMLLVQPFRTMKQKFKTYFSYPKNPSPPPMETPLTLLMTPKKKGPQDRWQLDTP